MKNEIRNKLEILNKKFSKVSDLSASGGSNLKIYFEFRFSNFGFNLLGKYLITGFLALTVFLLLSPMAQADEVCNQNNIDTNYKKIYCDIRLNDNESADEEIVEVLARQFGMDEELIKEIMANTICETVKDYKEDKKADLPEAIQNACLFSGEFKGKTIEQVLGGRSIFTDIRNAYEKERVIRFSRVSLEFKFKVSEQYWDGQILFPSLGLDAPFDLIVDLNLIEIVLFGSKAQWMNDVFAFPTEEEEEEAAEVPFDELLPEEVEVAEGRQVLAFECLR